MGLSNSDRDADGTSRWLQRDSFTSFVECLKKAFDTLFGSTKGFL